MLKAFISNTFFEWFQIIFQQFAVIVKSKLLIYHLTLLKHFLVLVAIKIYIRICIWAYLFMFL